MRGGKQLPNFPTANLVRVISTSYWDVVSLGVTEMQRSGPVISTLLCSAIFQVCLSCSCVPCVKCFVCWDCFLLQSQNRSCINSSNTHEMHASVKRGGSQVPGLDGLRALSIAAVIGFHGGWPGFYGGGRGVDLFFVISGFLITWLLLQEKDRFGSISLRRFYARRTLRI